MVPQPSLNPNADGYRISSTVKSGICADDQLVAAKNWIDAQYGATVGGPPDPVLA